VQVVQQLVHVPLDLRKKTCGGNSQWLTVPVVVVFDLLRHAINLEALNLLPTLQDFPFFAGGAYFMEEVMFLPVSAEVHTLHFQGFFVPGASFIDL
jgi:hypothetical protein